MELKILITALAIEILTVLGRSFLGSVKNFYKKHSLRIRIHHGYVGIILILANLYFKNDNLLIAGTSLLISDAIHHFIVLPLWVGKTEFP